MPLGCEYHYVIFRKDCLLSSKARLECLSDGKALAFVNALLANSHAVPTSKGGVTTSGVGLPDVSLAGCGWW